MSKNTSRFLAVNLTEAEWQALRGVTPDPCAWIREQIHKLLDESGVSLDSVNELSALHQSR